MRSYEEKLHSARGTALQVSSLKFITAFRSKFTNFQPILFMSEENNLNSQSANI